MQAKVLAFTAAVHVVMVLLQGLGNFLAEVHMESLAALVTGTPFGPFVSGPTQLSLSFNILNALNFVKSAVLGLWTFLSFNYGLLDGEGIIADAQTLIRIVMGVLSAYTLWYVARAVVSAIRG